MKKTHLTALFGALMLAPAIHAQVSIAPLTGFGGPDGWLAPGEGGITFLGTVNNERGMAFGNDHVYVASRAGGANIQILNKLTGASVGSLDTTGISGGTFAVNAMGVGSDGAIYVANLTVQSTTSPLKIYKWATEASIPTVVYSGDGGLAGARLGDSLAVIGSGSATRIALGFGSSPAVAGNNSYSIIDPTSPGTATAVALTGTSAGDFRLGISFTDSSHVLGAQGNSLYRYTSYSGAAGTLLGSPTIPDPAGATANRLMSYAVIGGVPLLAMQSIGDSHVSIYDATDLAAPIWLASANATSGTLTANTNGSGNLDWDYSGSGDTAALYAMSTNQGMQAFTVTVPEPSVSLLALAGLGLMLRRRR